MQMKLFIQSSKLVRKCTRCQSTAEHEIWLSWIFCVEVTDNISKMWVFGYLIRENIDLYKIPLFEFRYITETRIRSNVTLNMCGCRSSLEEEFSDYQRFFEFIKLTNLLLNGSSKIYAIMTTKFNKMNP